MGILDKLRPQSKSTHPDPNIRIEAIHELDPADIESLNAFAKDDTDARVRRVAVARIGDASVLADIVRNESEGSVRDHALGQLVEQASKHDAGVAMTAVAAQPMCEHRATRTDLQAAVAQLREWGVAREVEPLWIGSS